MLLFLAKLTAICTCRTVEALTTYNGNPPWLHVELGSSVGTQVMPEAHCDMTLTGWFALLHLSTMLYLNSYDQLTAGSYSSSYFVVLRIELHCKEIPHSMI